jgi:hypothetical protein
MAAAAQAQSDLSQALADFAAVTDDITAYDTFTYEGISLEGLQSRLDDLNGIDTASLSDEDAEAIATEIAAVEAALASNEANALAEAVETAQTAEDDALQARSLVDRDALTEALLSAANENRVAEYGEENYVDEPMLEWAEAVLGVGDKVGKIDEVRDYLDATSSLRETVSDF